MGVPKFFRWINERYPCICEVVKEYQIPAFDNLYLDMNGIIHTCSHPNDDDPHFRISQEQIFLDIFHYIEFLFLTIKPTKVFFMAVDGVAPRAKMNQQRGRRFRSAKDAEVLENNAIAKGEKLPDEERFDSNCITPGTKFMADLNEQLKYFVAYKISTDKLWQGVKVYLSGHETPGEGEHKIMDFIRYSRSQPDYDPNTTHCLYGLDADLLMLGLSSHEPHFSLLREEVKFSGKKAKVRKVVPEDINFFLLHLSLMRDYIEHEFESLKPVLKESFDLEAIIDDWVLMGFLVGNDFIPNIPNFHIKHDALPLLYQAYMKVMPTLEGYMNEGGFLNLKNFEKFIQSLAYIDYDKFSDTYADLKYFESKRAKNVTEEDEEFQKNMEKFCNISDEDECEDEESGEEIMEQEFIHFKKDYYINKLEYNDVTPEVMRSQALGYIQAIQWNLHYYYNGIASWSWYFPHHYAPYISDIKDFSEVSLDYDMGQPFLPFQQLLGVLPAASRCLLPHSYQKLMTSEESPMKPFYPEDFKTDLNGKTQEWEAVVLIPFIEESLLVDCTQKADSSLTQEERMRNTHGPHQLYQYTEEDLGRFPSSLPGKLPDIAHNHAKNEEVEPNFFRLPRNQIKKGLLPGAKLDVCYPGFPTLKYISHRAKFESKKVRVFERATQKESLLLYIEPNPKEIDPESLARKVLGKVIQVDWPFLKQGKVKTLSTSKEEFSLCHEGKVIRKEWEKSQQNIWSKKSRIIAEESQTRRGIALGPIEYLLEVQYVEGLSYVHQKDKVVVKKHWTTHTYFHPYQNVVMDISVHTKEWEDIELSDFYQVGKSYFIQGGKYLGFEGTVVAVSPSQVEVMVQEQVEPNLAHFQTLPQSQSTMYMTAHSLAQKLGINPKLVSRITGTLNVEQKNPSAGFKPINIGFNLKFNKKNEEVPGYTKRQGETWLYSEKIYEALQDYIKAFPEMFDRLAPLINQESIPEEDLFPEARTLPEVRKWIKEQPFFIAPKQSTNDKYLNEDVIENLETYIQTFFNDKASKRTKTQRISLDPSLLYRPYFTMVPDLPKVSCQLYDRIVNIRDSYCVPLGLRGTIVGIHFGPTEMDTLYDVLFDKEFANAMSIRGSSLCGYRVPATSFIKLPPNNQRTFPNGKERYSASASKKDKKITILRNSDPFLPKFIESSPKNNQDKPNPKGSPSKYPNPSQKDYATEWDLLTKKPEGSPVNQVTHLLNSLSHCSSTSHGKRKEEPWPYPGKAAASQKVKEQAEIPSNPQGASKKAQKDSSSSIEHTGQNILKILQGNKIPQGIVIENSQLKQKTAPAPPPPPSSYYSEVKGREILEILQGKNKPPLEKPQNVTSPQSCEVRGGTFSSSSQQRFKPKAVNQYHRPQGSQPRQGGGSQDSEEVVRHLRDKSRQSFGKDPIFTKSEYGPTRVKYLSLEMPDGRKYFSEHNNNEDARVDLAWQALRDLNSVGPPLQLPMAFQPQHIFWAPQPACQPQMSVARFPPPQQVTQIPESYLRQPPRPATNSRTFVPPQVMSQTVVSSLNPNAKPFTNPPPRKSRIAAKFGPS